MIGGKTPYQTGEFRSINGQLPCIILGHIWWPVEKVNAYHLFYVDKHGVPVNDQDPQYVWDLSHGDWPIFTPEEV